MKKISTTKFKDHDEWLELRRQGIGGSDAATIVGLNQWSSPYLLWLDKLGKLPPEEENEAIRQGKDLEGYVAERFCEQTGKKVRRRRQIIRNSDYPFAHANIDRWIVGENAGLECKTTSPYNLDKFSEEEFPQNYYIQCLHYMAVTGADKYYLAVLIFGKDFKVYEFERDEVAIKNLMQIESDFWKYVDTETEPPVDGTSATDEGLKIQYGNPNSEERTILFGMNNEADYLMELKNQRSELDEKIKTLEQEFKQRIGNSVYGETDRFLFSWKPQTRKTFQSRAFIKDHPDLDYEPYYKTSESRVFKVKEIK